MGKLQASKLSTESKAKFQNRRSISRNRAVPWHSQMFVQTAGADLLIAFQPPFESSPLTASPSIHRAGSFI
jgi:hypothetical protein